jgi:hypothetical protein
MRLRLGLLIPPSPLFVLRFVKEHSTSLRTVAVEAAFLMDVRGQVQAAARCFATIPVWAQNQLEAEVAC